MLYLCRHDGERKRAQIDRNGFVALPAPRARANGRRVPLRVRRHPHVLHLLQQFHRSFYIPQLQARVKRGRVRVLHVK